MTSWDVETPLQHSVFNSWVNRNILKGMFGRLYSLEAIVRYECKIWKFLALYKKVVSNDTSGDANFNNKWER